MMYELQSDLLVCIVPYPYNPIYRSLDSSSYGGCEKANMSKGALLIPKLHPLAFKALT